MDEFSGVAGDFEGHRSTFRSSIRIVCLECQSCSPVAVWRMEAPLRIFQQGDCYSRAAAYSLAFTMVFA